MSPSLIDQALGCLLAGAVGDALGAPVEFHNLESIQQTHGPGGIRDLDTPVYGRAGAITDDTQMTLFTAEGLIRAWVRGYHKGSCHPPSVVHQAYLRWLRTQDEAFSASENDGWLLQHAELWQRRAPGNTCLSALRQPHRPGQMADNHSKGCGGVMRVAPAAFFFKPGAIREGFELGADLAHLTHGHPSGYLSSGALVVILQALIAREPLERAVQAALHELAQHPDHAETTEALQQALALAKSDLPAEGRTVERLGGGWVAEEALAIAVYCALVATDLESALILAVNHSGDSDSTGAICGNILGLQQGPEAIPARWLAQLELREVIEQLARDLVTLPQFYQTEYDEVEPNDQDIQSRYPGH